MERLIRSSRATKTKPGAIVPVSAKSIKQGLELLVGDLREYYAGDSKQLTDAGMSRKYKHYCVMQGDDLHARLSILYKGEAVDNTISVAWLQQQFIVFFNVFDNNREDERKSFQERDLFLGYLLNKRK